MIIEIIVILLALFITVMTVMLVASLVLQKPTEEQGDIPRNTTVAATPPPILWSENMRNNTGKNGFPPCYDLDINAKSMHAMIMGKQKLQKYKNLLDVISIVLCVKKARTGCDPNRSDEVKPRLIQLVGMGANVNDASTKSKARAFIPVDESNISKFLVAAMNLIDSMVLTFTSDYEIDKSDREQMLGYVYNFYNDNFSFIYNQCSQ